MFAMMDDFSALCWRIGKRFITSGAGDEQAGGTPAQPAAH
jgi:hypothetical protein